MTAAICSWSSPEEISSLESHDVHVWRAWLDQPQLDLDRLRQTLSTDERTRATCFYFQRDQDRFIAARGLLRIILGRYLNVPPHQLRFHYNGAGKPALAICFDKQELSFNLSHSHGIALYAMTHARAVGVDIERIDPNLRADQIAKSFFAPAEVAELFAIPSALRPRAFLSCWTRKEAYVKARGDGLSHPLDQFQVSLAPSAPAALLSAQWDPQEASRWSLYDLAPWPEYVAALAIERPHHQVMCFEWTRPFP
jgi:4'-phosphopantetheinyl transferase